MELSPIAGMYGVEAVKTNSEKVSPTLAVEETDRMGGDAYRKHGEQPKRGIEEEGSDEAETDEQESQGLSSSPPSGPGRIMNLFA